MRYLFYVSSALLRGRRADAGSVARVSAAEIEGAVLAALEQMPATKGVPTSVGEIERVVIARDRLVLTKVGNSDDDGLNREFKIEWSMKARDAVPEVKNHQESESEPNEGRQDSAGHRCQREHHEKHAPDSPHERRPSAAAPSSGRGPRLVFRPPRRSIRRRWSPLPAHLSAGSAKR